MMWWLMQNALSAAGLMLCAFVIERMFRLSPSTQHVLWLLVVIRLIAPPLPLWPWPLESASPAAEFVTSHGQLGVETAGWSFGACLAYAWLAGAIVVAVLEGVRLLRLHRQIARGHAFPQHLQREVEAAACQLGMRPPRRVVVARVRMPLVVCSLRPILVIPEGLLGKLGATAWRSVLAHELVHLKRHDHWTGWVELTAACIWWWNPVFWYARKRMRECAELACDAWVVRLVPNGRREYAESLIAVIDTESWNAAPIGAIGMASG
ncbi:MAG: M56 family metallopeptidase, partial [Candidatus Hydrogenedentales bacterium]